MIMGKKMSSNEFVFSTGKRDIQTELAGYFFSIEPGERILSVRDLSAGLHVSVGAVSNILNSMQEEGFVRIEKRGRMGSFLIEQSLSRLYNLMNRGPIVIAMGLPMHRRFEGLATATKRLVERMGIDLYFIFMRGAQARLQALHDNRCHAALMSCLSAEAYMKRENEILFTLPETSWISEYGVFYRPSKRDILRVGVDLRSYDHVYLTNNEFGDKVEQKSVSYIRLMQLLKNDEIDAIVWNKDQEEDLTNQGIEYRPLSQCTEGKELLASFVGKKGNHVAARVLSVMEDTEEFMRIQRQVVNGEIPPEY